MNINYVDKEVQLKLCNLFLIPKKKTFIDILLKRESINEEQIYQIDKYLTSLFKQMGYEKDIEISNYDDKKINGELKDTNITFQMSISENNRFTIDTIEKDDTNYYYNYYYIYFVNTTYDEKKYRNIKLNKYKSIHKSLIKTTIKFDLNEEDNYFIMIKRKENVLDCSMYYSNKITLKKECLDDYFNKLEPGKSIFQIYNDIIKLTDLTIEELNHFHICKKKNIRQNDNQEYISFNDGKLACLGAAKDGTGYDIRDGKYKIITKDTNSLNKYNIEFEENNAILTINNNKFLIPLDILTYSNSDFTNRIETYRIGSAIEKQLAMRKKDIPK